MNQPPGSNSDPFETSNRPAFFAFLAGAVIILVSVAAFIVFVGQPPRRQAEQPVRSRPAADQTAVDLRSCAGEFESCLDPLVFGKLSWADCGTSGKRVCVVTIGAVDQALVNVILKRFREEYGIDMKTGPAMRVPLTLEKSARLSRDLHDPQIDADDLMAYLTMPPTVTGISNFDVSGLSVIALTSVDIYTKSVPDWLFVFGQSYNPPATSRFPRASIVSYYRMDDRIYGRSRGQNLVVSRIEKLVGKYVGLFYFGLPQSPDPYSAMYDTIRSNADLDRMSADLQLRQR